jgi:hypothetical protein
LKKSLIFTPKTPYLASSTIKMSNISYMKNIALKNNIDEINSNQIIKENNKDEEEEEEEDDKDEMEKNNEEEDKKKTWIKIKDKLSQGIFPCDILKEFPSFYENYNDKIMYFHFKYVTKLTENKFQENIFYKFINNLSISNSSNSFSIIPKSKITLPDLLLKDCKN